MKRDEIILTLLLLLSAAALIWGCYMASVNKTESRPVTVTATSLAMKRLDDLNGTLVGVVCLKAEDGMLFKQEIPWAFAEKISLNTPFTTWRITETLNNGETITLHPSIKYPTKP